MIAFAKPFYLLENYNLAISPIIMTALFIVLALEQILKESNHISSISGFIITAICLLAIGQTYFLLLALLLMVIEYTWIYRRLQRRAGGNK